MPAHLIKCLFLLFCSSCLLACTTKQLLHSSDIPANQSRAWLEQIQVGDTVKIIQTQEKETLTFKVKEINSTTIFGERGQKVQIDGVASVEKVEISWLKTTLLITGIVLVAAAASIKSSLDDIDFECKADCEQ